MFRLRIKFELQFRKYDLIRYHNTIYDKMKEL